MVAAIDPEADFIVNALPMAYLADAAYDDDDPFATASFQKTEFSTGERFFDQPTNTAGFVAATDKHVVLAFQGTEDVRNWLTNLNFVMRKEDGGKVHQGFAEALDTVWDDVQEKVTRLLDNDQWLWVTGHSLGGALATLATKRLGPSLRPNGVFTFGQPRVGDSAFADKYTFRHFRFVNNKDIVPTVPSRFIPGSFPPAFYTHVNKLCFFDEDGNLAKNPRGELGILPDLTAALHPLAAGEAEARALVLQGIRDHNLASYIACIKQNLA